MQRIIIVVAVLSTLGSSRGTGPQFLLCRAVSEKGARDIPNVDRVSHGQVPLFANYLAGEFRAGGFADEDIHLPLLISAGGEDVAALVVTYRGDGPADKKPILLLAHMVVVEALPPDWERDPFTLVEEDDYYFGRGTVDDKFGTTTLTTSFLRLNAEGFMPSRYLVIANGVGFS